MNNETEYIDITRFEPNKWWSR